MDNASAQGPIHTVGWELEAFADTTAAFVFTRDPIGVTVLDRLTWLVLELCDGRPRSAIVDSVTKVMGAGSAEIAARVVDQRLGTLALRGLVDGEDAA